MLINEIRSCFLDYYTARGHKLIPSASLVPVADASLLLINAGMAPLKRYFMGQDTPPAPRATSSQKCVRTIDIDQVGFTNRHNTFFEMLGKFSFGDYFKLQAMQFTLEWMTGKQFLGLDPSRLYITHHERDEEARGLWLKEMGWPEERLFGLGDKDNLWAAGDVGPWGFDTEYFWDFAPDGQPVTRERFLELSETGRIVEVGNDVFMQFQKREDGVSSELPSKNVDFGGGLERFAMVMQGVNTVYKTDAMDYLIRGFAEVVANASQHTPAEDELFGIAPGGFNPYWLAADHIRTATFLLGDGVTPGNVGRNYVLRRLIRRIIAQAYRLGVREPFIMKLADLVIGKMGAHYVELKQNRDKLIEPWINKEEQQFFKVMDFGYGRLVEKIEACKAAGERIPGAFIFELYDTYGFPADLALEICREFGAAADQAGFETDMAAQKERARGAAKFAGDMGEQETEAKDVRFLGYSQTDATVRVVAASAVADIRGIAPLIAGELPKDGSGAPVPGLKLITDATPFYADSGGQPSDSGWLIIEDGNYEMQSTATRGVHIVKGEPGVEPGSSIVLAVDTERRNSLRRPHTMNHLMLGALKTVLGGHVNQAGSQLGEDEIRFDFSHFQACTADELRQVEALVNKHIIADHRVNWIEMPLVEAKQMGVTAVFDEKYGAEVRVVSIGDGEPDSLEGWVSRELCGGTHLDHTSQAGMFLIVKEESVQSGVRRIYAVTGHKAFAYVQAARRAVDWLGAHYKRPMPNPAGPQGEPEPFSVAEFREMTKSLSPEDNANLERSLSVLKAKAEQIEASGSTVFGKIKPSFEAMIEFLESVHLGDTASHSDVHSIMFEGAKPYSKRVRNWLLSTTTKITSTEKQLQEEHQAAVEARRALALGGLVDGLAAQAVELGGIHVLAVALELSDRGDLKYLAEKFAGQRWPDSYAVFIAADVAGGAALCCKVSPEAQAKGVKANELIKATAALCKGGGGGRPDFAEAGGKDGAQTGAAVELALKMLREKLG